MPVTIVKITRPDVNGGEWLIEDMDAVEAAKEAVKNATSIRKCRAEFRPEHLIDYIVKCEMTGKKVGYFRAGWLSTYGWAIGGAVQDQKW